MNKINYWLFFQLYFIIIKSSPTSDVTIVLQKLTYSDVYNITCILSGENLKSGIAWIQSSYNKDQTRVSKYVPTYHEDLNCKMNEHERCTPTWISNYWNRQNSYITSLDVVTDDRWEEFQVIYTNNKEPHHIVQFPGNHKNKLMINFSIRVENQVDVFLCNSDNPKGSKCYWILLNSNEAAIRRCVEYEIDYYWIGAKNCLKYRKRMMLLSYETLSINSWKHFTIAINKNNVVLKLSTNNITLLNYIDNEHEYIDVNHLLVGSNGAANWKFHTYEFIWTTNTIKDQLGPKIKSQDNKFCISLYIAMCSKCTLIIHALHSITNSTILTKTVKTVNEFKWQNVKWNEFLLSTSEVWLYFETQCVGNNCKDQFWALDDFRVCTENEVRVLNIYGSALKSSAVQIVDGSFQNFKMEDLDFSTVNSVQFLDPKCPIDSIGSSTCTRCSDIFSANKPFCDESIICDFPINEKVFCRCSPGFLGQVCSQPCSNSYYGQDCKEPCGSCESTPCNHITGNCLGNKCSYNYLGKQCKISPYAVLRNPPILTDYGDTYITIQITNFSYYGLNAPDKFKVIYKFTDNTTIWNETMLYNVNSTVEIPLNNLQSDTSYDIRVVLLTPENEFYNEFDAPGIVVKTKCADITEEDLIVKTTNTSAVVTFRDNPKLCPLKYYKIYYYNQNEDKLVNQIDNQLHLKDLLPYTEYILNIIRINSTQSGINYSFKTEEGVPNLTKFDIYERSNKMLRLRITPPYPPTGVLEYYQVVVYYYTIYSTPWITENFKPINCKIWTKYHCIDIISETLSQRTSYIVTVQAKNKNVSTLGGCTDYVHAVTTQGVSNAPEELSYAWDDYYNLTLQWNHPNFTNGPLTKFKIIIRAENEISCYTNDYMVTEEITRLTYQYVVLMENKDCYASQINVIIQCFNVMAGGSAQLNIYSPPETPSLNNEPFVESVSNTTITIALSAKNLNISRSSSFMYIVLSESKSKFEISDVRDLYKLENLVPLEPPWLIAKYNLNKEVPMEQFTLGRNESNSLSKDDGNNTTIILSQNTSYTITIIMYNEYQNRTRYRIYEIVNKTSGVTITSNNSSSSGALFSLILLLLLPLLLWIYIRKRENGKWCLRNMPNMPFISEARVQTNPDVIPLQNISSEMVVTEPEIPPKEIISSNVNISKDNDKINSNKFSKPIKLNDFSKYVKNAITTGELARQHSLFARGQTKPWDYGNLPQNKFKNRYNNLVAYDHTRVILGKINNDQYSDYINANYIDGYNSKKAYIATQGPKLATINDFWRMIWQENVKHIVMLANILEGGKKKTEQYWPNINQTSQFENISVTFVSTVVFADYEHRTFLVTSNNTERQIEQLHFTSWPDHGIPLYSQSLVPLFKKLLSIPQEKSPIVVHCSAGVGRTGTVILCDLCLRMSLREDVVDVLKHQHKIREQRANLVDNIEQYKLVHLVLLDCLINPDTSITCNEEAEKNILHLLETDQLEKQFQYISKIAWQDQAMRPVIKAKQKPEWKEKNKFENIVANEYGHIVLSRFPPTDEQSDYINAVEVDGFKERKRFIATQQPLPNTVSDFWRMIDEKDVSIIVSLNDINKNDNKSCIFWPTSKVSEMQPVSYLLIKFLNEICNDEIITVNIELHNTKNTDNPKRNIKLIILKGWPSDELMPNSNVSLLKLFKEVEKVSQNKNPIVVTCYDGAAACGLFIAFSFVIEKIKLEHQCDVCLAVRTVRRNRDQFVQNLDQFKYLYRAAIAYLSIFELYSNFL